MPRYSVCTDITFFLTVPKVGSYSNIITPALGSIWELEGALSDLYLAIITVV